MYDYVAGLSEDEVRDSVEHALVVAGYDTAWIPRRSNSPEPRRRSDSPSPPRQYDTYDNWAKHQAW